MDGEDHFVHKSASGQLLVVGMFLESTRCGKTQTSTACKTDGFAAQLISALDGATLHHPVSASLALLRSIPGLVPFAFLDGHQGRRTFNYAGSLTTPNCDEIVDWWVIEKPLKITTDELAKLRHGITRLAAGDH